MKKESINDLIESFLPYQIAYTANYNKSFRREFQAKFVTTEMSADEFAILLLLDYAPDISQTDIAKYLFKGKAHIGKMLNDMEERGYIERVVDIKNNVMIKRNVVTPKGTEYLNLGNEKSQIIRDKMDKEFSQEEREKFISYLKRFRGVLSSIVDVKLK